MKHVMFSHEVAHSLEEYPVFVPTNADFRGIYTCIYTIFKSFPFGLLHIFSGSVFAYIAPLCTNQVRSHVAFYSYICVS